MQMSSYFRDTTLAHFGNAAKTALEAGHSEAMLFRVYREVVTPEAAAAFWAIRPAAHSAQPDRKIVKLPTNIAA